MKSKNNYNKGSRTRWSLYSPKIKGFIFSYLILAFTGIIGIQTPLQAQALQYTKPTWWFGAAAGANFNYYRGTTQELNEDLTVPAAFHHGKGIGLFIAPLVEYQRPDSRFGVMLQSGFDSRKGKFDQVITPCNCPADLSATLRYLTLEPSLRFTPFKSSFYVFGGPRLAFNLAKEFTYRQGTNPLFTDQPPNPDVTGDFSNVNKSLLSLQIGAGYDFELSTQATRNQYRLSPFVSFQPYFGQNPRSMEKWTLTTLRVGAALKVGRGRLMPAETVVADPQVQFTVNSPENIPVERRVRETFPLRNYVYFNIGSTEIADRYVLITKDQVKDFKEDQLEVFTPKKLSGRSRREMIVYYNVINILGDRMQKNPSASIVLVGSSEKGPDDGKAMAESIRKYLASVFGIDPLRIGIEGRDKPKIPSEQPGGKLELELLREGDRRVSIESSAPALLMEFQSGPDAPLRPVEIIATQTAPLDSYVTFNVDGAKEAFSSWSLEVRDEKGKLQYFGPYFQDKVSLPGKSILGTRASGDYTVTMIGQTKNNKAIRKEASMHMVLWTPQTSEQGMRFSVIFEFNESHAIRMYEKYLTEIVTPKIPVGGTVIIHGYTDIIGDETHNQALSLARANEVKTIIEKSLANAGRKDVKFEVYGFGEDENLTPFENRYPEERSYNRSVVIDIIPAK